jgi:hypothetical protein
MWQNVLIAVIVGAALVYVVWTLMPSRLRAQLRVRLHLAAGSDSGATKPAAGVGELPCGNCAHNNEPHVRSHR